MEGIIPDTNTITKANRKIITNKNLPAGNSKETTKRLKVKTNIHAQLRVEFAVGNEVLPIISTSQKIKESIHVGHRKMTLG